MSEDAATGLADPGIDAERWRENDVGDLPAEDDGTDRYDLLVVDRDGDGDYETIQGAVDGSKSFPPERVTILVTEGVYEERVTIHEWNPAIELVGEPGAETVLAAEESFGEVGRGRNSTFHTGTLKVAGNDFYARNLTVRNIAGPEKGQAIALHTEADRIAFEHCRFEGAQDTVYAAGEGARQYFRDCYVDGTTDFVFGGATAVFEDCQIHAKADSYVTAASTAETERYGYVFRDCELTAAEEVSEVFLGRPWRNFARTAFVECELGAHVRPEGWHNWGRESAEANTVYAEYGNTGPGAVAADSGADSGTAADSGADVDDRVDWALQLTPGAARDYETPSVLGTEPGRMGAAPWYEIAR